MAEGNINDNSINVSALPLYVESVFPGVTDATDGDGGGSQDNHSPPTGNELSSGASFVTSRSGSSYLHVDVQNDQTASDAASAAGTTDFSNEEVRTGRLGDNSSRIPKSDN